MSPEELRDQIEERLNKDRALRPIIVNVMKLYNFVDNNKVITANITDGSNTLKVTIYGENYGNHRIKMEEQNVTTLIPSGQSYIGIINDVYNCIAGFKRQYKIEDNTLYIVRSNEPDKN